MSAGPDERGRDSTGGPPSGERRAADRYGADDAKRRLGRFLLGNPRTIAGAVYGTIVVLSVLTAGATAHMNDLWRLTAVTAMSVIVLWVAHVYSHGLGESITVGRRLTAAEVASIARRESAIPLAAVPPVAAVALGATGVIGDNAALWLAFAIGVLTLAAQGMRYAKLERMSRAGTIITLALNLALGLSIVALKVALTH
jgi:hypothetical protein